MTITYFITSDKEFWVNIVFNVFKVIQLERICADFSERILKD